LQRHVMYSLKYSCLLNVAGQGTESFRQCLCFFGCVCVCVCVCVYVDSNSLSLGFVFVRLVWTLPQNYDKPALDLNVQQSVPCSKHRMLYREIIAVCSQIHAKHINTLCGQNLEFLNVIFVVHTVTTVRYI
jgi:hypothetical protein